MKGWMKGLAGVLISLCLVARVWAGVQLTSVQDVVYRADGTPMQGTMTITWPEFTSADGSAVGAGSITVTLGADGKINVGLAPNAGAVPAGTFYKVVSYRAGLTSKAEQTNTASIAALANGADSGVRSSVHGLQVPEARSTQDCSNAGLALLDDGTQTAWQGTYEVWSDFLGASDVRPGDAVTVKAPSQNAQFSAIVRGVEIAVEELREDRSVYRLKFANDAAETLGFRFDTAKVKLLPVGVTTPGNWTLEPVKNAALSQILASQVTIATNLAPPSGGGFEVRGADQGWGAGNDRNLWGRFTAQSFVVPRLSRSQAYYVRQYDAAGNYSRDSVLLRVDWPL